MKIFYLCDGKVEGCAKTDCGLIHENGGCFHTSREENAKNQWPHVFKTILGEKDEEMVLEEIECRE